MAWDESQHPEIQKARYLTASAAVVYEALRERADFIKSNRYRYNADETLEWALLERNDPHITLALACTCASEKVLSKIYDQAAAIEPVTDWSLGVRVACLANEPTGQPIFQDAGLWLKERLDALASSKVGPELLALAQNAMAGKALAMLLKREGHFSRLSDDGWLELISAASKNPRLNIDESDEHGPDLTRFNVADGIANVITTTPVAIRSYWGVNALISSLNPFMRLSVKLDLPAAVERWSKVPFKEPDNDREHTLTGLTLVEEFCCKLSALFGEKFEGGKFEIAGNENSDSKVLRCAYYGNASLKEADIKAGVARDAEMFVFAALCNTSVLSDKRNRIALEENLCGMWEHYAFRCKQYKERWPNFDTTPITEQGREIKQQEIEAANLEQNKVEPVVQLLRGQIAALESSVSGLRAHIIWGFIGLAAAMFFLR